MSNKTARVLGLVIIIVALVFMQSGALRAQAPANFSAATKTAGATAALYGAGAVLCSALTAGGCGIGMAVGGVIMGATGVAINMFPSPNDTVNWYGGSASQMPDYEDYGGAEGDCSAWSGNASTMLDPFSMPCD